MTARPQFAVMSACCALLLFLAAGCGGDGGDSKSECAIGTQGCECTPGGACNDGLSCLDGFCLETSGDVTDGGVTDGGVTDAGEGSDIGETDAGVTDTVETDTNTGDLNACGGTGALQLDGETAEPGGNCGCGGVVVCEGPDALRCVGDRPENSCGGCAVLPGTDGESCGPCGDGAWECVEGDPDAISCAGATEPNDCGGCGPLDCPDCDVSIDPSELRPAWACRVGEGDGSFVCDDASSVSCQLGGGNACGGFSALIGKPGAPCGANGMGVQVCDGDDAVACDESGVPENACGGRSILAGVPDEPCGDCGTWTCDDTDPERVVCIEERNACGGCGELDGAPGDACESGVLYCEEPDSLACADTEANACGGSADLNASPGEPCGDCLDGVVQCVSPDLVACVGSTPLNACGGCGLVPGVPGDFCGEGAVWECGDDGVMSCVVNDPRNACGGRSDLEGEPGVGCPDPSCNLSRWTCTGEDFLLCLGDTNNCGGCVRLTDPASGEIADPNDLCGTCDSGRLRCNPENPNRLLCIGDEEDAAFTEIYPDSDGDGEGDRDAEPGVSCIDAIPDGFVDNAFDCDDDNPSPTGSFCSDGSLCGSWLCTDAGLVCDTSSTPVWYRDDDDDGFGSLRDTIRTCTPPAGYVDNSRDCVDSDEEINPDAEEIPGDSIDQDCNDTELCFIDGDLDGARSESTRSSADFECTGRGLQPDDAPLDCNDSDATVSPFAEEEFPGDGIDQDCDGEEICFLDVDEDGARSARETGASTTIDCSESGFALRASPIEVTRVGTARDEYIALLPDGYVYAHSTFNSDMSWVRLVDNQEFEFEAVNAGNFRRDDRNDMPSWSGSSFMVRPQDAPFGVFRYRIDIYSSVQPPEVAYSMGTDQNIDPQFDLGCGGECVVLEDDRGSDGHFIRYRTPDGELFEYEGLYQLDELAAGPEFPVILAKLSPSTSSPWTLFRLVPSLDGLMEREPIAIPEEYVNNNDTYFEFFGDLLLLASQNDRSCSDAATTVVLFDPSADSFEPFAQFEFPGDARLATDGEFVVLTSTSSCAGGYTAVYQFVGGDFQEVARIDERDQRFAGINYPYFFVQELFGSLRAPTLYVMEDGRE